MKIIASNLFRTSFPGLGNRSGNSANTAESVGQAKDSRDAQRLKNLQEGLRRLGANMTPKQMAKQAAAEKIGMLQRRLMQLKQMLLYATPEQAKALARELKSIAGELASAAKAAGGASGTSQGTSTSVAGVPTPDVASALSGVKADSAATAQSADAQVGEGAADETKRAADAAVSPGNAATANRADKAAQEGGSLAGKHPAAGSSGSAAEIPEATLKDMLKEARKLLKEVIDLVKRKMGPGDQESRKDLAEAESKLRDIGLSTETQVDSVSLYTSQGVGTTDGGGTTASGINISVEA